MSSEPLAVEGTVFSIAFFFICPEGHVHIAEVKWRSIVPKNITKELIETLQQSFLENQMKGMRVATDAEVDRFFMTEEYANNIGQQKQTKTGQDLFMMPGVEEAQ